MSALWKRRIAVGCAGKRADRRGLMVSGGGAWVVIVPSACGWALRPKCAARTLALAYAYSPKVVPVQEGLVRLHDVVCGVRRKEDKVTGRRQVSRHPDAGDGEQFAVQRTCSLCGTSLQFPSPRSRCHAPPRTTLKPYTCLVGGPRAHSRTLGLRPTTGTHRIW